MMTEIDVSIHPVISWVNNFIVYVLPLLLFCSYLIHRRYQYWALRGLSGPTPVFPLGYFYQKLLTCPRECELKWAKKYGKMYGTFNGLRPTLTITDPELIRQVMSKDFHHFINRRTFPDLHPIWPKSLFFVQGQDWKRIRSISSPAFTSSKIRRMYPLLHRAVEEMLTVLDGEYKKSPEINIKAVTIGYTMAAIASTMFNIDPRTNNDPKKFNEFRYHGTNIISIPRFIASSIFPKWILQVLGIRHPLEPNAFEFLNEACRKIIRSQNEQDCLVTMMKKVSISEKDLNNMSFSNLTAKEEDDPTAESTSKIGDKFLTENEIVAQMVTFFFAGFESTASTISNTIFELAHNQDVQKRLQSEVDECFENSSELDIVDKYEAIKNLPYLDAVLKEAQRKNPVVVRLERCLNTDNYKLGGIELEKNTLIEIPTQAIQLNDEYWPNPEKFDPERFFPENRDKIIPHSYIPFGDGPRNCIGMRFAITEVKAALYHLVHDYSFHLATKTPKYLDYLRAGPILRAKPYPILFKKR